MNNLKYYNDSLAYDFNMFMPRPEKGEETPPNIVKLPKAQNKAKARKKAAVRRLSGSAFAILASTVILAALCGNIFLRLQINEVASKINTAKSEIDELESEKTGLEMEFERRISYENIELEATKLGMKKKDKSQVKYIRVNDKNTAATKDGNEVTSSN